MQHLSYKMVSLAAVLAFALLGSAQAQQHQQHHPGGAQSSQDKTAGTDPEASTQTQMVEDMQGMMEDMQDMMEDMQDMMDTIQGMMGRRGMINQGGMMERRGMMSRRGMVMRGQEEEGEDKEPAQRGRMGRGMRGPGSMMSRGGMMMQHFERLAQQLEFTDAQRAQAWTLFGNHAKDMVRLKAEIDTMAIDVRQLLETDPVDLSKGKQLLQAIAGKEADMRLSHLTAMQEIAKLLTPEQQQKFRAMRSRMMGHGGMMGHGMMGR
jgi:Spy/CpxP family protein refolding chaperone